MSATKSSELVMLLDKALDAMQTLHNQLDEMGRLLAESHKAAA